MLCLCCPMDIESLFAHRREAFVKEYKYLTALSRPINLISIW